MSPEKVHSNRDIAEGAGLPTCPLEGRNVAIQQWSGVGCDAGIQLEEFNKEAERGSRNGRALHDARDALQAVPPEAAAAQDECQARQHKQNGHNVCSACISA